MPRLALCLLALLLPGLAAAAEIGPGRPGLCAASLTGVIAPGDTRDLAATEMERPADWPEASDGRWRTLCLDSPGGSLAGGLELAQYLLDNRIGTVVPEAAECLSTCALVFMFGTAAADETVTVTSRRLHVAGRLGFHQPALAFDPEAPETRDVTAAFDVAVQAVLRLFALAGRPRPDSPRPFIDGDLLEAMLQYKGTDFFEIDTVNKAGRWDIAAAGITDPGLTEEGLFYACQNMTTWSTRLERDQIPYEPNGYSATITEETEQPGFAEGQSRAISFAGMMQYDCRAGLLEGAGAAPQPVICGYRQSQATRVGPEGCLTGAVPPARWTPIPPLAFYAADTPLRGLAPAPAPAEPAPEPSEAPRAEAGAVANAVANPVANPVAATVDPSETPCLSSGSARVTGVERFTSLRAGMSHDTERLDELPLDSEYTIPAAPVVDWAHPEAEACAALCVAADAGEPYDSAALQACIDDNWMWFELTGPSGKRGFASARYLDY
jgi:hypothetical protein